VSLAVVLIVSAIATPVIMSTLHAYQLNDSATRLAGMVKLTRFEAIRRNKGLACRFGPIAGASTVWTDLNNNTQPDTGEAQLILASNMSLVATPPNPGAISTAVGASVTALGVNGAIFFDARGAVTGVLGGVPAGNVVALYIGDASDPASSYAAVVVMPSGATQVWKSSAAGDWRRIS
jgi:Tfp pilus assembly protein FimT